MSTALRFSLALLVTALAGERAWGQCRLETLAAAGAPGVEYAGSAVALSGDRAVLGAPLGADGLAIAGAAYVFEREAGGWVERARLVAQGGQDLDQLGAAVAIDGDTLFAGAPLDDTAGADAGAVLVFEHDGGSWVQVAELHATVAAAEDWFGSSVAASSGRALIGAPTRFGRGAAYVFERVEGSWTQVARLVAPDGFDGHAFGQAVALDGDTALVGAPGYNVHLGQPGAYVFDRVGEFWFPTAKLAGGGTSQQFGASVALANERAVVGSPHEFHGGVSGAAYVFERLGFDWPQVARLTAAKGSSGDRFGASAAVAGEAVLVGAPGAGLAGYGSGAGFLFHAAGGAWTQIALLGDGGDFGAAVALADGEALVGAPYDGTVGAGAGAAHLWTAAQQPPLTGTPAELSLASGGTQVLALGGCEEHAGALYLVVGSFAPVGHGSPALLFGGYLLPLAVDAYLLHTLAHPNQAPLSSSLGLLDGSARGSAGFTVPAGGDPAWSGLSLFHAFAVLNDGQTPVFVSNAMPVTLVP